MGAIQRGWNHLGLQSSQFLQNAKIKVDPRPREVQGSLLLRPTMVFGNKMELDSNVGRVLWNHPAYSNSAVEIRWKVGRS